MSIKKEWIPPYRAIDARPVCFVLTLEELWAVPMYVSAFTCSVVQITIIRPHRAFLEAKYEILLDMKNIQAKRRQILD